MDVDTSLRVLIMENLISFGMWILPHNDKRDRCKPSYTVRIPLIFLRK